MRVEGECEPFYVRRVVVDGEGEVEDGLGGMEEGAGVEEERGRDEGSYGFGNLGKGSVVAPRHAG